MKKSLFTFGMTLLAALLFSSVVSCEAAGVGGKDVPDPSKLGKIPVVWAGLSSEPVDPDTDERATVITFKFDKKVEGLSAGDFTFESEDGLKLGGLKLGDLTPSGDDECIWTMEVGSIPENVEKINVGVEKEGFLFAPDSIKWGIVEGTSEPATPVTGITLGYASLDLAVGASVTLEGTTLTPSDATGKGVRWSSDAPVVAKVGAKTGSITGVLPGKAVITVASVSNPEVTASCTVYVAVWEESSIGETGPGGGTVFYDKGAYIEGWRYMEIAPADASEIAEGWGLIYTGYRTYEPPPSLSVAAGDGLAGNINDPSRIIMGNVYGGVRIPVNTSDGEGTGKANTLAILDAWAGAPTNPIVLWYATSPDNLGLKAPLAAQRCAGYSNNNKSGWFMPSKGDLELVYSNLVKDKENSGFSGTYWSSSCVYSESDVNHDDLLTPAPHAWTVNMDNGESATHYQTYSLSSYGYSESGDNTWKVRAARIF